MDGWVGGGRVEMGALFKERKGGPDYLERGHFTDVINKNTICLTNNFLKFALECSFSSQEKLQTT